MFVQLYTKRLKPLGSHINLADVQMFDYASKLLIEWRLFLHQFQVTGQA